MGSCVARSDDRRPESSAPSDRNCNSSQTPQHRLQPRENAVRALEVNAPIGAEAVAGAAGGGETTDFRLHRTLNVPELAAGGGALSSRNVMASERDNEPEYAESPLPSPPPALRSPPTERTSHASTLTLTDETSYTRPESLVTHVGGSSIAAEVSYDTDATTLDESAKFSSIPLVAGDGDVS